MMSACSGKRKSLFAKGIGRLCFGSFVVLSVFFTGLSYAGADEKAFSQVVVEAEGTGTDRTEALVDAWKEAVRQAMGMVLNSSTVVADDTTRERILLLSRGFIDRYDIVEEGAQDQNVWKIRLVARIRKDTLLQGLLEKGSLGVPLDGKGLYATSFSKERRIEEATEMLAEWITSFAYENFLEIRLSEPDFDTRRKEARIRAEILFDEKRYFAEFVPEMERLLDYLSEAVRHECPFVSEIRSEGDVATILLRYERNTLGDYLRALEIADGTGKMKNRLLAVPGKGAVYANTYLVSGRFYAHAYRVPGEAFAALWDRLWSKGRHGPTVGVAFSSGALRLSLRDKDGHELHEVMQPLRIDTVGVFADPATLTRIGAKAGGDGADGAALLLLPAFGNVGKAKNEYDLFTVASGDVVFSLEPKVMKDVSSVTCRVELKR